jgi:excisionase family DNA binding protein
VTVKDAARALEVSEALVYDLCKRGRLAHYRIGLGRGRIRIDPGQVAAFRAACRREATDAGPEAPPSARRPETVTEALDRLTRLRDPDG